MISLNFRSKNVSRGLEILFSFMIGFLVMGFFASTGFAQTKSSSRAKPSTANQGPITVTRTEVRREVDPRVMIMCEQQAQQLLQDCQYKPGPLKLNTQGNADINLDRLATAQLGCMQQGCTQCDAYVARLRECEKEADAARAESDRMKQSFQSRLDDTRNKCSQLIDDRTKNGNTLLHNRFCPQNVGADMRWPDCAPKIRDCTKYINDNETKLSSISYPTIPPSIGSGIDWNQLAESGDDCAKVMLADNSQQIKEEAQRAAEEVKRLSDQIDSKVDEITKTQAQNLEGQNQTDERISKNKGDMDEANAVLQSKLEGIARDTNDQMQGVAKEMLENAKSISQIQSKINAQNRAFMAAVRAFQSNCLKEARKEAIANANAVAKVKTDQRSFRADSLMDLLGPKSGCEQNALKRQNCYQEKKFKQCKDDGQKNELKTAEDARDQAIEELNNQVSQLQADKQFLDSKIASLQYNADSKAREAQIESALKISRAVDDWNLALVQQQRKDQIIGMQMASILNSKAKMEFERSSYNMTLLMSPKMSKSVEAYGQDFRKAQESQSQVDLAQQQISQQCCDIPELLNPRCVNPNPDFAGMLVSIFSNLAGAQAKPNNGNQSPGFTGSSGPNGCVNSNQNFDMQISRACTPVQQDYNPGVR